MSDPYVEVVGKVEEANVVVMLASTDLGSDFSKQNALLEVLFIKLDQLQLTRTLKIITKLLKHQKTHGSGIYSNLNHSFIFLLLVTALRHIVVRKPTSRLAHFHIRRD